MPATLYFSRPFNVAFHNLCALTSDCPKHIKSLLGLGLNFIPTERICNFNNIDHNRFIKDLFTRCYFLGTPSRLPPKLFIRSDWIPSRSDIPIEYRIRIDTFLDNLKRLCPSKKNCSSNLLPLQRTTLSHLRQNHNLVIFPSDKNLGPAIIDRQTYIKRAFSEHLSDTSTYRQLTPQVADNRIKAIRKIITNFINSHFKKGNPDRTYLQRTLDNCTDPFAYFYLLAKVHKTPWKTRPIISVSGSILQGLGRWVDCQLKIVCQHLPFVIRSSHQLCLELKDLVLPPNALLFSIDAISMYTNIDTLHALNEITEFLQNNPFPNEVNIPALIDGLRIVMTHNTFRFGDTFWIQLTGTAMGAPPAPMYATLYYYLQEAKIIPTHHNIFYYGRYIDDGFGIWIPHPDAELDEHLWQQYLADTAYGKLKWEATARSSSLDFLDLTITICGDKLSTKLYEKALNLYLYLPPHSSHSPNMTRGIIRGMILRIFRLTSDNTNVQQCIQQFYDRLVARGFSRHYLLPIFQKSLMETAIAAPLVHDERLVDSVWEKFYLHIRYHPQLLPANIIQKQFHRHVVSPDNEVEVHFLKNHRNATLPKHKLIIAYHRPLNLQNYLSCRKMDTGVPVSTIFRDEFRDTVNPNPNPNPYLQS
jgi:hypothetical protein